MSPKVLELAYQEVEHREELSRRHVHVVPKPTSLN